MKVIYLKSFSRTFDDLSKENQIKVTDLISDLLNLFGKKIQPRKGIGLKKISKNLWEIRIDIKLRLLFSIKNETLIFALVGSHNDIKRFLQSQ
jgi:mRNA-degrading endonuclease RelE of RelBE toxin-antitoxin system